MCRIKKIAGLLTCLAALTMADTAMAKETVCRNPAVWVPSESSLCNATWGIARSRQANHRAELDDRLSCRGKGPANAGTVLDFVVHHGKYSSLMSYQKPVSGMALDSARIETYLYIPADYQYWNSGRFALGLRIGDPAKPGNCMSGGCPPDEQTGSSVRVNYTQKDNMTFVPLIYSYHLNRPGKAQVTQTQFGGVKRVHYGNNTHLDKAIPRGQWVKMVLKVTLNDVGKDNGSAKLSVYDLKGNLITSNTVTKAVFRKDKKWKIIGPIMTEKFNLSKPPPKTQHMYYRDYRILNCQ